MSDQMSSPEVPRGDDTPPPAPPVESHGWFSRAPGESQPIVPAVDLPRSELGADYRSGPIPVPPLEDFNQPVPDEAPAPLPPVTALLPPEEMYVPVTPLVPPEGTADPVTPLVAPEGTYAPVTRLLPPESTPGAPVTPLLPPDDLVEPPRPAASWLHDSVPPVDAGRAEESPRSSWFDDVPPAPPSPRPLPSWYTDPEAPVTTPEPAAEEPAPAPAWGQAGDEPDRVPATRVPAPVFPDDVVDLTEAPAVPAPVAAPAASALLAPKSIPEPVPGTVEVDPAVSNPNETVVMPVETHLDDHRIARARALGDVAPGADVVAAPQQFGPPSTYKGWPSFALFVARLIVATLLSIRATQQLLNFSATKALWATSILPNPSVMATSQIILEYVIALMLLLGLGSRIAGVLLMVLYIAVLTFLIWGADNPFTAGVEGFRGEFEVLMVIMGLVFAGVGGGRAAVDGAIHKARLERKNAKLS